MIKNEHCVGVKSSLRRKELYIWSSIYIQSMYRYINLRKRHSPLVSNRPSKIRSEFSDVATSDIVVRVMNRQHRKSLQFFSPWINKNPFERNTPEIAFLVRVKWARVGETQSYCDAVQWDSYSSIALYCVGRSDVWCGVNVPCFIKHEYRRRHLKEKGYIHTVHVQFDCKQKSRKSLKHHS